MSKIIAFPPAQRATAQVVGLPVYSLADLGESAMDTTQPQGLGAEFKEPVEGLTPNTWARPQQDWSNQELASLYRAQRLLSLTGISFDVDRGLTDEGDPWFVFLDEADQVIAHFCRIDGMYYLDSAAQSDCIVATSLEALVGSFARRNEMLTASGTQSSAPSQVIDFNSVVRAKVLMHPGVSLAALIWSVYVLSDGLVLPLWKQDPDVVDHANAPDTTSVLPVELERSDFLAKLTSDPYLSDNKQGAVHVSNLLHSADSREANSSAATSNFGLNQSYVMNVIGFGLTAVSMSYGIYKWALPASILPPVQEILTTTAVAEAAASDEMSVDLAGFFTSFADALDLLAQSPTQTGDEGETVSALARLIDHAKTSFEGIEFVSSLSDEAPLFDTLKHTESAEPLAAKSTKVLVDVEMGEVSEGSANNLGYGALSKQDFFQKLTEFNIIDAANFNELVSSLSAQTLPNVSNVPIAEQNDDTLAFLMEDIVEPTAHALFDQAARDFVVFLLMKDEDPQRSAYNGEIVLIDMTAFDGSDGSDGGFYTRSWSFEDGSVLSTVGLKSDFEAFGLIY
jgi:hypothetical protein